jgi:RNA polymerase primary sigma factor
MVEYIARWKQASRDLEGELGRPPSLQELARVLDLPMRKIQIIRRAVKAIRTTNQVPVNPDGESGNASEYFADEDGSHPAELILRADELATIRRLLESIDEREATVLRLRFGLDGRPPLTLKEIGKKIGLTRERVRQIEFQALDRLNAHLSDEGPARLFRNMRSAPSTVRPRRRSRSRSRRSQGSTLNGDSKFRSRAAG